MKDLSSLKNLRVRPGSLIMTVFGEVLSKLCMQCEHTNYILHYDILLYTLTITLIYATFTMTLL